MKKTNLRQRLHYLIEQLRQGNLDDRERQYLSAVLDHYHRTINAWRDQ